MAAPENAAGTSGITSNPQLEKDSCCVTLGPGQDDSQLECQSMIEKETEVDGVKSRWRRKDSADLDDKNASAPTASCNLAMETASARSPGDEQPDQPANQKLEPASGPLVPVEQAADDQGPIRGIGTSQPSERSQLSVDEIIGEILKLLPDLNDNQVDALGKELHACGVKSRADMSNIRAEHLVNAFGTENAKKVVAHFNPGASVSNLDQLIFSEVHRPSLLFLFEPAVDPACKSDISGSAPYSQNF
ncbi:uncharacterized protein LOC144106679 isoform X2 [Amblyomma americanum]